MPGVNSVPAGEVCTSAALQPSLASHPAGILVLLSFSESMLHLHLVLCSSSQRPNAQIDPANRAVQKQLLGAGGPRPMSVQVGSSGDPQSGPR